MEITTVNRNKVPQIYKEMLKQKVAEFRNGNDMIMIALKHDEKRKWKGIYSAWRRLCLEWQKSPHLRTINHELGLTVYLWYE